MSSIEWTDKTWNPVVGCSRVSKGCERCYAERVAHRGMQAAHRGLTVMGRSGPRWNGTVRALPERLGQPLRWRKPRRVFVNSMSDLFHEAVPFEFIAAVFGVMAACPQHTFQILTKRDPRPFFDWVRAQYDRTLAKPRDVLLVEASGWLDVTLDLRGPWPLRNVELLVSVEDQATADERIPWLLECDAGVRGVSYEPALGPVDFNAMSRTPGAGPEEITEDDDMFGPPLGGVAGLDWIVVGGESGPGARPFDLAWARSTIEQGRAAGVPVFVKQVGSWPYLTGVASPGPSAYLNRCALGIHDRKGGDPSEWPEDLRVREFPKAAS